MEHRRGNLLTGSPAGVPSTFQTIKTTRKPTISVLSKPSTPVVVTTSKPTSSRIPTLTPFPASFTPIAHPITIPRATIVTTALNGPKSSTVKTNRVTTPSSSTHGPSSGMTLSTTTAKKPISFFTMTFGARSCSSSNLVFASNTIIDTNPLTFEYSISQLCSWTIVSPPGLVPKITFISFGTEAGFDFLNIYDGRTASSQRIFSGSGIPTALPTPVSGSQAIILVQFTSDKSISFFGVRAAVTFAAPNASTTSTPETTVRMCSTPSNITVSGTIINTNVGSSSYANLQTCQWIVTAPSGKFPQINFVAFSTENSSDFLNIYAGISTSSPLLFRRSGVQSGIPPIIGVAQQLLVTFSSDARVVRKGVLAIVSFSSTPGSSPDSTSAASQSPCSSTCATCLSYRGGPVLTHAVVIPVYWNSNVAYSTQLSNFYSDIFRSAWFSNFAQYNVLPGTRGTPYISNFSAGPLTDAQIQAQLRNMFSSGALPAPNSSTYYPIHFPPGVSITLSDGTKSCAKWCAYHGTFVYTGVNVQYGVIPDQGGNCAGGCGTNSQTVNNLISVSSHELMDALTDPAIGIGIQSWFNNQLGEIADICNAWQTIATVGSTTYVVQMQSSNCAQACV